MRIYSEVLIKPSTMYIYNAFLRLSLLAVSLSGRDANGQDNDVGEDYGEEGQPLDDGCEMSPR